MNNKQIRRTSASAEYGYKLAEALNIFDKNNCKYRVFKNDSGVMCVQVVYNDEEHKKQVDAEIYKMLKGQQSRQVYNSIKDLRAASGMTQQAFSDYFGIQIRPVQSWELGERKCKDYLIKLMEYKLRKEGYIK